ncbi:MAG: VPLPA-CTERM sorting domain-containing protein [Minisyncoccota bacterium]
MCDDFDTHVSVGDTWSANVYTYADVQSGAGKFASLAGALTRYSETGWLYSQVTSDANHNADIQQAVWKVMGSSPTMSANGNSWYALATDGSHGAYDWSGTMRVVTPNPLTASQEYLIPAAVPVPSAAWLFGSGLLGLIGVARRRALYS